MSKKQLFNINHRKEDRANNGIFSSHHSLIISTFEMERNDNNNSNKAEKRKKKTYDGGTFLFSQTDFLTAFISPFKNYHFLG